MNLRINQENKKEHKNNNPIFTALLASLLITASLGTLITATIPIGAVVTIDYELTIIIDPTGSGEVNPPERIFPAETQITLIATPLQGYQFTNWSGDIPLGSDEYNPTLTLIMDEDKTITVHFIMNEEEDNETDDDEEDEEEEQDPCEPMIDLPEGTIIMYAWEEPEEWPTMFKNKLTEIYGQYEVSNGTYHAWCVDYGTPISSGLSNPHTITLYNSYQPPDHLQNDDWHKINYILNHRQGDRYDVQRAIWYFVNFGSWDWDYTGYLDEPVTQTVYDMIDDALENSDDWCPGCGDIIAVINDPGTGHGFQITIIEAILCEENPIDDDPGDDDPGDDDPGDDDPGDDDPGDDDPGDDEPGDDEPGDDEPGDDEPGDDEPGDDEPGDEQPTTIKKSRGSSLMKPRNNPPVAIISEPFEYTIYDQPITFDGSTSYDPDTDDHIVSYNWDFGDGIKASGISSTHEFKTTGSYYVTLTVMDTKGAVDSMSTSITIIQPNRAPTKPLIGGFFEIPANTLYSFAASSTDPDNDDIKYIFNWGDGIINTSGFNKLPEGSAYNLLHSWSEPGEYTLNVTVTDGQLSSSSEVIITVVPTPIDPAMLFTGLGIVFLVGFLFIFFILKRRHPKALKE